MFWLIHVDRSAVAVVPRDKGDQCRQETFMTKIHGDDDAARDYYCVIRTF